MHQSGKRLERFFGGHTLINHGVCARHQSRALARHQGVKQRTDFATIGNPDHLTDRRSHHSTRTMRNGLIKERKCITHAAGCSTADLVERCRFEGNALRLQDLEQAARNRRGRHIFEAELQTPRQNGDRHFLRVGGCQHKDHVCRWLFKRLEHGIESVCRKHVDFIDHIDLRAPRDRRVDRRVK